MITNHSGLYDRFINIFINGGITATDSEARARAIRLSNIIGITTVVNGSLFGLVMWHFDDFYLAKVCVLITIIFAFNYSLNLFGYPDIGRPLALICGNIIVFWFSCYFKGEALLQLFFFTLGIAPFMYFSWEERAHYLLIILPIIFLIMGEINGYDFFHVASDKQYDMKTVHLYAIFAPLNQIIIGFYYFLKQSVKFENESHNNLEKLEIEYRKQLQVQKMSSLGEMAGGVAHEVNNPLAIILMRSQFLKRELNNKLQNDDPAFTQIDMIESTVNRIAKIIRGLLNFSRNATHDPMEKRPLKKIVQDTLDLCSERFESAQITLKVILENDLEILCRPTEISQVLLNLLNNSYDAVYGKANAWVEIRVKPVNGQVEIIVEDSGSGIPADIADKIFEPFFTTKAVGKGTGLGLSVSSGLIADHNGKLSLIPNTGKTTFQILLPKAP